MNLKSLLLGSAGAVVALSSVQAADAIVAAEPEPMEYVRVCDTFGAGYFYIPGSETCLKIGGYVRAEVEGRSDFDIDGVELQDGGYRTRTRAQLELQAKTDTELGTLTSLITLRGENHDDDDFSLNETYIELGGLRVGYFYNYFDIGLDGETFLSDEGPIAGAGYIGGDTLNNSIRYTFANEAFQAYLQADAFNSEAGWKTDADDSDDELGINGLIGGTFGGVSANLFAAYEFDHEETVIASTITARLGPGTLGIMGVYSTGASRYWDFSEWSIGAEYAIAVNEKFSIAPGVQYWDNILYDADGNYDGGSAWRVGVTADYEITEGLDLKATVNYTDVDLDDLGDGDRWDGFLRLQRSF
ncbi:porin [Rhizobiaceae bacterium LC148]|jgi:opacity protein-like surface antigen|nr:porin [Rhizobiaceae bacterium LC148]